MALEIPNGFAQCAYRWSLAGDADVMVSTVGVDFAAMPGSDQANVESIADAFLAGFGAAEFSNAYTYLGVVARVGISGGAVATHEAVRNVPGTFASAMPPQNCAVLVRKRTAVAGKRGAGRMYLPPFSLQEAGVQNNGVIDAGQLPGIQANVTQWFTTGIPWVLLHDALPTSMEPTPITNFIVDGVIATQRRRLRR